ncbi:MAG: hypothetical protein FJ222_05995 [Lentisphaerae bacterium]|nr:hypothetical protein [Lentisphaerota bacterium]
MARQGKQLVLINRPVGFLAVVARVVGAEPMGEFAINGSDIFAALAPGQRGARTAGFIADNQRITLILRAAPERGFSVS